MVYLREILHLNLYTGTANSETIGPTDLEFFVHIDELLKYNMLPVCAHIPTSF